MVGVETLLGSYLSSSFRLLFEQHKLSELVIYATVLNSIGERPYKCTMPDCGRDFVQMANLQFHLRNHEAQRRRATEEKTGYVSPSHQPTALAYVSTLPLPFVL